MTAILNRSRARQIVDFEGLKWGTCRPTDIDMSWDFKGEVFFFVEAKLESKPLTIGQRLHLEGLVNGLRAGGKMAIAIHASHTVTDPDSDIMAQDMIVQAVYTSENPSWDKFSEPTTLKSYCDRVYYALPDKLKRR